MSTNSFSLSAEGPRDAGIRRAIDRLQALLTEGVVDLTDLVWDGHRRGAWKQSFRTALEEVAPFVDLGINLANRYCPHLWHNYLMEGASNRQQIFQAALDNVVKRIRCIELAIIELECELDPSLREHQPTDWRLINC